MHCWQRATWRRGWLVWLPWQRAALAALLLYLLSCGGIHFEKHVDQLPDDFGGFGLREHFYQSPGLLDQAAET